MVYLFVVLRIVHCKGIGKGNRTIIDTVVSSFVDISLPLLPLVVLVLFHVEENLATCFKREIDDL